MTTLWFPLVMKKMDWMKNTLIRETDVQQLKDKSTKGQAGLDRKFTGQTVLRLELPVRKRSQRRLKDAAQESVEVEMI